MSATVITFSVQLGTPGYRLAQDASRRLGYSYLDRDVTTLAASRAGVSPEVMSQAEHRPSFIERLLESLAETALEAPVLVPTTPPLRIGMGTSDDYRKLIEEVVDELARRGNCIIVGHAAQAIMKEHRPGLLRVLIHGSLDRRAVFLSQEQKLSLDEARRLIEESDRERSDFFRHVYKIDWLAADRYDLTLNTDVFEVVDALEVLLAAAKAAI